MTTTTKPTRRDERRAQTVREIKQHAMDQISEGGPDAVSLTGIVREMSMSPAALYRYFANRDALLADLVVDAYDELADSLVALGGGPGAGTGAVSARSADAEGSADADAAEHLDAVLRGTRTWALAHPNAYRLIFQTSIGSGADFAPERTIPASSRSMGVIVEALAAVAGGSERASARASASTVASAPARASASTPTLTPGARQVFEQWSDQRGLPHLPPELLMLAFLTWTRLHGIISLELGGHLASTGIGADLLFEAEVRTIHLQAAALPAIPSPESGAPAHR